LADVWMGCSFLATCRASFTFWFQKAGFSTPQEEENPG
jgi:hypothetical protein